MRRIYSILIAAITLSLVSLMLASFVQASISTEYYAPEYWNNPGPDWVTFPSTCSPTDAVEFSIRAGDLSSVSVDPAQNLDEIYYMFGGEQDLITAGDFDISNDVDFGFTLIHDSASGDFIWSIDGGPSTTWHSGRPGESVQNIFLVAFTKNNAFTSTVKDLVLNGQLINETVASINKSKPSLRIFGESFSDFILQGNGNFAWSSGTPQGSQVEIRISVVFASDDIDGEGFGNACDSCLTVSNGSQSDCDGDGIGDACDTDSACTLISDGDGDGQTENEGDCDDEDPNNFTGNVEVCDGTDNDCDAVADNGLSFDTDVDGFTSIGSCEGSADDCDDNDLNSFPGNAEVCDGADNNCDGTIDENLTQTTSCGVGECGAAGIETCTAGTWGGDTCVAGTPSAETCDNFDNNCDGAVDNGVADIVTGTDIGECQVGIQSCVNGEFAVTQTEVGASAETCDNLDNNCDGAVDEGVTITFYVDSDDDTFGAFYITEDACLAPPGFVSDNTDCDDLVASVNPGAIEICDGIDNNCDTFTDEECGFQDAYNAIPEFGNGTIQMQPGVFSESLILDRNVTAKFMGEYDAIYNEPATTIVSPAGPTMIISNGLVITENIILQ